MTAHRELVVQVLGSFMRSKVACCQRRGGPDDLLAILDVRFTAGESALGLMESPVRDVVGTYRALLEGRNSSAVEYVALLADCGYKRLTTEEWNAGMAKPGAIMAAREEGDLSVQDVLLAVAVHAPSRAMFQAYVRYTYDDRGQPSFSPPEPGQRPGIYHSALPLLLAELGMETG